MIFKDIKQGNTVYMLDKGQLTTKCCRVTATAPHLSAGIGTFTQAQGQLMVDVTIDDGGKTTTFTIPENLAVTFAGDLVLATSQQGLSSEVERMKAEGERILASVERQKSVIEKSGELLARLNPQYREKQETEKRFRGIEGDIGSVKEMVQKLLDKLG